MSTSVTSVVSHFPSAQNGFTTTLASTIASGATTVPLNSVAGYVNGSVAVFVIDPTSSTAKQTFTGIIDTAGVQVTSVVWTAGTNQTHTGGTTVVDYETATHWSMVAKGLLVNHAQDGTHIADLPLTTPKITTSIKDGSGNTIIPMLGSSSTTSIKLSTTAVGATYIESGCVWTADAAGSTKAASMTAGVIYINGIRLTVAAVTARTFTASKDVYVDFTNNADGTALTTYIDTTTNAASPALTTAGATLRNAIVVVGATNIAAAASVNQGQEDRVLPIASSTPYAVTDSLGNLICPRDPQSRLLGYRQDVTDRTTVSATAVLSTGLTVPVIVPAGRKIKVTAFMPAPYNSLDSSGFTLTIWDGTVGSGTQLNLAVHEKITPVSAHALACEALITPASSSKTYNAGINVSASGGTMHTQSTVTTPSFIKVELA